VAMTATSRPEATEYPSAVGNYIALVPDGDIMEILEKQRGEILALLRGVSEEVGNTRHSPYTWSVKEVVGHVTDCERIFGYRALRFAREDATPLPGFDEGPYVQSACFDGRRLSDLVAEFDFLRRSHLCLFRGLPSAAWMHRGVANGNTLTVRAVAYVIAGHARHHSLILAKRLGREFP
jgi:DinB superfamily